MRCASAGVSSLVCRGEDRARLDALAKFQMQSLHRIIAPDSPSSPKCQTVNKGTRRPAYYLSLLYYS